MAKNTNPVGVYSPWNWRARRLISQLRKATHRTVQNAIIQELIHELQTGSRRVKRTASQWGQKVRTHVHTQIRRHGSRAGTSIRKRLADLKHRIRFGPRLNCHGCGQEFRNKLQFAAHVHAHKREETLAPRNARHLRPAHGGAAIRSGMMTSGTPAKRSKAKQPTRQQTAQDHARDVLHAAGPQGRAVAEASRQADAARPLGARDLKNLARQVTSTRDTVPASGRPAATPPTRPTPFTRPGMPEIHPSVLKEARERAQTPESRRNSRAFAIVRRELRQSYPFPKYPSLARTGFPGVPSPAPARTAPAARVRTAPSPRT